MPNVTFIRLLRVVKLVRVLRVVRVMRVFHQLRVLVTSIASSMGALFWSMVLLFVIELIAAIFMAQVLTLYMENEENDLAIRSECFRYFGTWARAMVTVFEMTLAPPTWSKIGRLLIFEVHGAFIIFFALYLSGVSFAVIRVITAIFLKETLEAAKNDKAIVFEEKMRQKKKYIGKLREVFTKVDADGSGQLSLVEFQEVIQDDEVRQVLADLELDVHEVQGLFALLDTGDGTISFDEFISGVMRLRGSAKSVDLMTLLFENKKILDRLSELHSEVLHCRKLLDEEG